MALLSAGVNRTNAGDALIESAVRRLLQDHRLETYPLLRPLTAEALERVNACEVALICGTNLYQDTFNCSLSRDIIERITVPIVPLGIGTSAPIGQTPIMDREGVRCVRMLHERCTVGSVRDPRSLEFVLRLGVSNVELTGCPVLFHALREPAFAEPDLASLHVSLRARLLHVDPRWATRPLATLRLLCERFSPRLVLQSPWDVPLAHGLAADYGVPLLAPDGWSAEPLVGAARAAGLTVNYRLHFGMLALAYGVPSLLIGTDTRVSEFCSMMGIPYFDLRTYTDGEILRALAEPFDAGSFGPRWRALRHAMCHVLEQNGLACSLRDPLPRVNAAPSSPATSCGDTDGIHVSPREPKPILVIGHDATCTGAPRALLALCSWLRRQYHRRFEVVLCNGGPLESAYATLAPTTTLHLERGGDASTVPGIVTLRERLARGDFALVLANSVETADALAALAPIDSPVIVRIAELDFRIRHQTGLHRFGQVRASATEMVAVSDAVRENLTATHGVDPARVHTIHGFIDTTRPVTRDGALDAQLRASLGIPAGAWVVGGCGTVDWRKGPDLFVQLAASVRRRHVSAEVHWIWVGPVNGESAAGVRYDAERLGVAETIHWVGEHPYVQPYFALFDVFACTSREDPFPRVVLEAAAEAVPSVCFDRAGGAPEFVQGDAGTVVPYLDVEAMADAILAWLASAPLRRAAGLRAREKVRTGHDLAVIGPRFVELIETIIDERGRLATYREASACATGGDPARARQLFHAVLEGAPARCADLVGKTWFKLATLAEAPADALRCCEHALAALPTHAAAARLRDDLCAAATPGRPRQSPKR